MDQDRERRVVKRSLHDPEVSNSSEIRELLRRSEGQVREFFDQYDEERLSAPDRYSVREGVRRGVEKE